MAKFMRNSESRARKQAHKQNIKTMKTMGKQARKNLKAKTKSEVAVIKANNEPTVSKHKEQTKRAVSYSAAVMEATPSTMAAGQDVYGQTTTVTQAVEQGSNVYTGNKIDPNINTTGRW